MDGPPQAIWTAGNRHLDQQHHLNMAGLLVVACVAILLAWPGAVTGQEAPPSVLVVPLPLPPAVVRHVCLPAAAMAKALAFKYSEAPVAIGLQSDGQLLQVYAAANGGWTIVKTNPSGMSCIVASGEHWQSLPGIRFDDSAA